ncbi:hypothetical protein MMC25_001730 [Agyrium rufum]|nr:hypothetical protein [Agyrium rufum]
MLTVNAPAPLHAGPFLSHHSRDMYISPTANAEKANRVPSPEQPRQRHMWIVTGPAGCGKTSVAQYLAAQLSIPYIEGDDFHPPANKVKMSTGVPLTDADRWDWLITLRENAVARLSPTISSTTKPHSGVVVTCSALKRKYRDVFRIASYTDHNMAVHFIYLQADEATLLSRVGSRQGHYMKSTMVHSQFDSLEEPDLQEQGLDVLSIDCSGPLEEVQQTTVDTVKRVVDAES